MLRGHDGEPAETPSQMFWRVARVVAAPDASYGGDAETTADIFYELLTSFRFMPNSPTFTGAGTPLGQLAACFVLPIDDSISEMELVSSGDGDSYYKVGHNGSSGIFDTGTFTAMVQKSGGGTGFSYSDLRPRGDYIATASGSGRTSGPISFLRYMNGATECIQQGASRRGANMATMDSCHPTLAEFIKCKDDYVSITNYNISVFAYDDFMEKIVDSPSSMFVGINPRNGGSMCIIRDYPDDKLEEIRDVANIALDESRIRDYPVRLIHAAKLGDLGVKFWTYGELFDKIIDGAWRTGDPGMLFADRINDKHPLKHLGKIKATNPCGEQPLLPWESCVLGSLDVSEYFVPSEDLYADVSVRINWQQLERDVELAVRFLDNCVEVNYYPVPQIERVTRANRKIGLGVMGFANLLFKLGIRYGSDESLALAARLMRE
ncbi:MAG: ribonucleotide reductase N-terminal alpha domain-containing protein, partial [bacterium]